jgi:hypothetical protein
MFMRSTQLLFPFLFGALLLAGCDNSEVSPDSGSSDAGAADSGHATHEDAGPVAPARVLIAFEHLANGTPIVLGTETPHTNAAGNAFGVTRLSYFVSDVTVTTAHGMTYSVPGAHYVDHDTASTRLLAIPVDAHSVDLTSISFVMGLPPALNVTGAFTSPPESLMEWPEMMGGGYHYMKLEGRYIDDAGEPFNMMVHSGGLSGTDYSFPVELQAHGVAIGEGDVTLTLAMNIEEWFTSPNEWDLNDYFNAERRGIMGNAAAQASLRENGAGVFTLESP